MTTPLTHRPGCQRPDQVTSTWGTTRDTVTWFCRSCKARTGDLPLTPAPARRVCGSHPSEPVDGRGRGCAACARERSTR